MPSVISKIFTVFTVASLVTVLSGCAGPSVLTITDSLQKLDDAGEPCLYPLFNGFQGALEGDQAMFCRDEDGGEIGYKLAFFKDKSFFDDALADVCITEAGAVGPSQSLEVDVLTGENWLASSDAGSKYTLADLKAILGGSEAKLADLCRN